MKYIRTKDGIYEVEKLNLNKIVGNIKYEIINNKLLKTMYGYEAHLFEYDIISQADTIEELCDLFYLDRGGDLDINDFYDKYQFDVAEEYYQEEIRHFIPIKLKAYIETDKGLIYVAKMNEDGELELI